MEALGITALSSLVGGLFFWAYNHPATYKSAAMGFVGVMAILCLMLIAWNLALLRAGEAALEVVPGATQTSEGLQKASEIFHRIIGLEASLLPFGLLIGGMLMALLLIYLREILGERSA